jgi:hypothetical protein
VNWFWKFVGRLLKKQSVRPSRTLSGERCASERPERPLFVWTREEAKAAWHANRTEVNLALTLPENVERVRSCTGIFVVDGKSARVVICVDEPAKRWILMPPQKTLEQTTEKARLERAQDKLSPKRVALHADRHERQTREKSPADPEPAHIPEIRCTNCDETKTQLSSRGKVGPCCKEPFWTVPYELIWRSLPHGEDR